MMRSLRLAVLAGAGVLLAASPARVPHSETLVHGATGHALGCIPSDAEKNYIYQVLSQLNDYRLANGLNALVHDLTLQAAMVGHCHHMAEHVFFAHTHIFANEPESQTPLLRAQANGGGSAGYGENIARGYATPTDVMDGWKASPGHNANMLNSSYTRVGIGYYQGGSHWGQIFGFGAAVSPEANSPVVAAPASAGPNPVSGTTTSLSALGSDDGGEANLRYTWSVAAGPAGVSFSVNGTNAAKNTVATFTQAGSYTLRVTIVDLAGLVNTSDVSVTVNAAVATVAVAPPAVSVQTGGSQPFTASAQDQFGNAMAASFAWSVSGGGTISSPGGMFTAGGAPGGPFTVTATSGAMSGTADVTVTAGPPTLTTIQVTPASATVFLGGAQAFAAVGIDQAGNPLFTQPSFTWSVDGGGTIDAAGLFTSAGTPGAFTVTATSGAVSGTASVTVPEKKKKEEDCGATGAEALVLLALAALRRRRRG